MFSKRRVNLVVPGIVTALIEMLLFLQGLLGSYFGIFFRIHELYQLDEIKVLEAHESEVLCLEYSNIDNCRFVSLFFHFYIIAFPVFFRF